MPNSRANILAVIFTAISVEYLAVRAHLTELRRERYNGSIYERGIFKFDGGVLEVGIVETGIGNVRAAIAAQRAIDYFKPSLILFVGVAGGLKDVKLGDVVAATKVYGYESGRANATFMMRLEVGNSDHDLVELAKAEGREEKWLSRIKGMLPEKAPKVFISPIAAGEKVVASIRSEVYTFLKTYCSDAVAIEMESGGFLMAAHLNQKVKALVIRGVSDLIEGKSKADAKNFQEIAARYASAFAFELLAKWFTEPQQINEHHPFPNFTQDSFKEKPSEVNNSSNRLFAEFRATLPTYYKKVEGFSRFLETSNNISFSHSHSVKNVLLELQEQIKPLANNSSMLELIDKVRLLNLQDQISQLLTSLHSFSNLRTTSQSSHSRAFNKLRNDALAKFKNLIESLKQFK